MTSKKKFTAHNSITLFAFLVVIGLIVFSARQRLFFTKQVRADHWVITSPGTYQYRQKITFNSSQIIGTLTNFPVFISFTDANLISPSNGGTYVTNANGYDIVFASIGGHPTPSPALLPFERTSYNLTTGAITAWVLVPSLSATTNEIYVYYGNTSVTASQSNASAVWGPTGANYTGVWHLDETASCSTNFADATGNGLTGTCVNSPAPYTAGQINGARNFVGTSQQGIALPNLTLPTAFTLEAWIFPSSFTGFQAIVDNEVGNGYNRWLGINGNNLHWYDGTPGGTSVTGPAVNTQSGFRHIVVTSDTTNFQFYVNGAVLSFPPRNLSSQTVPFAIGYAPVGTDPNIDFFNGQIDEVRISNGARNASWIQTSYNNQLNPGIGGFITAIALQQPYSPPSNGIVRSSEIDFDWVPGQSSWGQIIWSTTEPQTSDVRLRVYYTSNPGISPPCDIAVPNSILSGNDPPGFDINSSPLLISGLNSLTYNRLCLEATLTPGTTQSPTLNDWRITWFAPGVFNGDRVQSGYRWYDNANGLTPGAPLTAVQDTPATSLINGQTFRLRLMMHVNNADLAASAENYRLQFAPKAGPTCGLNMQATDEVYSNVTDTTAIAFADNSDSAAINGAPVPSMASDPQHDLDGNGPLPPHPRKYQSYQELTTLTFTNNQGIILQGEDGVWDFVLRDVSAPSRARYCFRMVRDTGASLVPLNGYAVVPEIMAGSSYVTNGVYISNPFAASARAWNTLEWRQTDVSASCPSCRIRLQIQTSTNGTSWQSNWCGPIGPDFCNGASFYTIPSGTLIPTIHNNHRWIRYRATFEGNGNVTPVLEEVRINYQQ